MPYSIAKQLLPLLLPLLLVSLLPSSCRASSVSGSLPQSCEQYAPLYESIDRDLDLFKRTGGITPELVARTIKLHSAGNREKGLAVAIYSGRVFVISNTRTINLRPFGHHVTLWVAYLRVLLALEEEYGSQGLLPNVEFVWHTIDRPVRLTVNDTTANGRDGNGNGKKRKGSGKAKTSDDEVNYPVFRFAKSPAHPDILVPIYHFYLLRYQSAFLDRMSDFNAARPWASRAPRAFARFTAYGRYVHPDDPHTQRLGAGGAPLCAVQGRSTSICPVRMHLVEWAANNTDRLDVSQHRHVGMADHAAFRYLLHVDGQGLSSKLEFLLTLGSLVLKEESGYAAYYHHLLKPYTHYVPVWRQGSGPEDILEAVDWARAHDSEARRIAEAGQAFAARYLNARARSCFWLRLLRSYAQVMTYDPVPYRNITVVAVQPPREGGGTASSAAAADAVHVSGNLPYIKPARAFLAEEVTQFDRKLLKEMTWEP